jgi:hypothetical protein
MSELADLHNRRKNIRLVSDRAKAMGFPYLVWPEDKELLRIDDLPLGDYKRRPNVPISWSKIDPTRYYIVINDEDLRQYIREGFAYSKIEQTHVGIFVQEYELAS